MKILACSFLFVCLIFSTPIYAENYSKRIYHAYVNDIPSEWEKVIQEIEKKLLLSIDDKLELSNYYYGYIGYLLQSNRKKEAKIYNEKALILINDILKKAPDNATANAYKGSFLSFKMVINKLKAVTAAPESMRYINKAYDLDPTNIQAVVDKGNLLSHAPAIAGGNKKEATLYYAKAVELMEKENKDKQNWFYLNTLLTLAHAYENINEKEKAEQSYQKILIKEPNFKLTNR